MAFQVPEYIRTLVPYVPGKPIEETQREFKVKRVVKLASNENPLGASPKARKAVEAHLKMIHRYPDGGGYRLKHALCKYLGVETSALILGNGSNEVIDQIIRTYCVAGDAIATAQAAFVAYKICAQIHGVQTLEVPLNAQLKFDVLELAQLVRKNEKVRVVFVANPNNPTGTYLDIEEMKLLVKELSSIRGGSTLLVLDYAYWEYVMALHVPEPLGILKSYRNTLILRTFSKIYGLAGLRVGYGIGTPEIISNLEKVRQPFNVNSLALCAAEAALADTVFVKNSKQVNQKGLLFWEQELAHLGIPFWKSQGNFLLIDTQKGLGKPGVEVYQECLRKGVIFRPVMNYGLPGALRISVGTPPENKWALQMLAALKKGGAGKKR